MEQVYHVVVEGMSHEILEIISWFSQMLILIVAGVAAYVARGQLKEMGHYRLQRLYIANAQLLLELDKRWDSNEMYQSRLMFAAVRDEINVKVGHDNPVAKDVEREGRIEKAWMESLKEKRAKNLPDYGKLMSMCGFFETVGLMVERNYIRAEDVFELFLGPIVSIEKCFGGHIAALEKETGVPTGLYKHARRLSQQAARNNAGL